MSIYFFVLLLFQICCVVDVLSGNSHILYFEKDYLSELIFLDACTSGTIVSAPATTTCSAGSYYNGNNNYKNIFLLFL
jgi:hypothetical protein